MLNIFILNQTITSAKEDNCQLNRICSQKWPWLMLYWQKQKRGRCRKEDLRCSHEKKSQISIKRQQGKKRKGLFVLLAQIKCVCVHAYKVLCVTYWNCRLCRRDIYSSDSLWLWRAPVHIQHTELPLSLHTQLSCMILMKIRKQTHIEESPQSKHTLWELWRD